MISQNSKSILYRVPFLDIIAGIAIIRVVFIHSLADYSTVALNTPPSFHLLPHWMQIADLLLRHNVPIFVFLAGYKYFLSASRHPERTYFSYIKARILRLVIPFLVWTWIYYLLRGYLFPALQHTPLYFGYPIPSFSQIKMMLLGIKHPGFQLWFIPMLILVNFLYPLLKCGLKKFWISLPVFTVIYIYCVGMKLHHPNSYLKFLLLYDLGAFFASQFALPHHRNLIKYSGAFSGLISLLLCIFKMFVSDVFFLDQALKVSIPIAIYCLFAYYFPNASLKPFVFCGRKAWVIYILHEPLIMFPLTIILVRYLSFIGSFTPITAGSLTIGICLLMNYVFEKTKTSKWLF